MLAICAITLLGYVLLAFAATRLALIDGRRPTLWPANAITLAMLILSRGDRPMQVGALVGAVLASTLNNVLVGRPVPSSVLYAGLHALEAWLAWRILLRLGRPAIRFDRGSDIVAFVAATAGAPLMSASVGAAALSMRFGVDFASAWRAWYGACTLGLLVTTPLLVIGARLLWNGQLRLGLRRSPLETVVILTIVGTATAVVFVQEGWRLIFVISPLVLCAALRLRVFGAAAATAIVAIVATVAIDNGYAAVASASGLLDQTVLLQLYLATTFLCTLPVAAVLEQRDAKAEALTELAGQYRTVVDSVGDVIFRTDADGRWSYLNPAWARLFGYEVATSIGRSCLSLITPEDRTILLDGLKPIQEGRSMELRHVVRMRTASGELRWVEALVRPLHDAAGQLIGVTGTLRDIDDRKKLEEGLATAKRFAEAQAREAALLAATDDLTGLANRRAFLRQLGRELDAARELGRPLTLAIFDVDHFKSVNDRFGHGVGDRVLRLVAARSAHVVRSGDVVGRIGGEEFSVLMPGATMGDAEQVAERFRRVIGVAPDDPGLPTVTVSVGLAAFAGHATAYDLLADADRALYDAKRAGRNRIRIAA